MSDYFDYRALLMFWSVASWFYASLLSVATVLFFLFIRNRRSCIPKSKRTLLSDSDLKVTADSSKNKRFNVFRLTGEVETATNEAATTWQMFYREQNRYLKVSDHGLRSQSTIDSIGALGIEIFDKEPIVHEAGVNIYDIVDMAQAKLDDSDLAALEFTDEDSKNLIVPHSDTGLESTNNNKFVEDADNITNSSNNYLNGTVSEGSEDESTAYTFEDSLEDMTESDVVDSDMLAEEIGCTKKASECMMHRKGTKKEVTEEKVNVKVESSDVEASDAKINDDLLTVKEIVVPNTEDGHDSCTVIDIVPHKVLSNVEGTINVESVKEDLTKSLSKSSELPENHTKLMLQCIPNEIVKKLSKEFDKLSSKSNLAVTQVDSNRKVTSVNAIKMKTEDFKVDEVLSNENSDKPSTTQGRDLLISNGNDNKQQELTENYNCNGDLEQITISNEIYTFIKESLDKALSQTPTVKIESEPAVYELKSASKDIPGEDQEQYKTNDQNTSDALETKYLSDVKTDILVYQAGKSGNGLAPNDLTMKLLDFRLSNSSTNCVEISKPLQVNVHNKSTPKTLHINSEQKYSRNRPVPNYPRSFSRSGLTSRLKKLVPFKKKTQSQRSPEPSDERIRDKTKRFYAFMVEELYGNVPRVNMSNGSETGIVHEQGPSSKGDEFHASSDKINEQVNVLKNHILKKHEAPKLHSKRPKELHCEEAIQSISYDGLAASSSKTDKSSEDIKNDEDSTNLESNGSLYSKQSEPGMSNSDTRDQFTSVSHIHIVESDSKIDKESILTDLLDMSQSNENSVEDMSKYTVSEKPSEAASDGKISDTSSALYFIKDSVENAEMLVNRATSIDGFIPIIRSGASNEHIKTGRLPGENVLAKEILNLDNYKEDALDNNRIGTNVSPEHLIKDISNVSMANIASRQSIDEANRSPDVIVPNRTFKDANNTSELLAILSRLTDKAVNKSISFVTKSSPVNQNRLNPSYESCVSNESNVSRKESFNNFQNEPKKEVRKRLSVCFKDDSQESMNKSLDQTSNRSIKNFKEAPSQSSILIDEVIATPLKKSALSERQQVKDCKAKVIPTYEITDGIKELMNDLVKPMADVMPFESVRPSHRVKKKESTCSTQIQANLITSSQIDLDIEHECGIKNMQRHNNIPKSIIKKPSSEIEQEKTDLTISRPMNPANNRVVVFDHDNPLNNVLLVPFDYRNVHKYEPLHDKTDIDKDQHMEQNRSNFEVERVTVEYNLMSIIAPKMFLNSSGSDTSKPASIDQAVDVDIVKLHDNQVNTEIAMKENSDILKTYSSLTLMQDDRSDASSKRRFDKYEKGDLKDGTTTQNLVDTQFQKMNKQHKFTNKKLSKDSMKQKKKELIETKYPKSSLTVKRSKLKARIRAKQLTIQQLITHYDAIEQEIMKPIVNFSYDSNDEENCRVRRVSSSLANSCEQSETERSETKKGRGISDTSSSNWNSIDQQSSKNIVADCEASANVVAKIDMLPFIGSRDCEWNSCGVDTWSFRLLHARVLMSVKLEHKIDNATRHFVRADTKVLAVHFDKVFKDKPNSISELCVRFALSAMRESTKFVRYAGDVPRALRLASSVSSVSLRWARAMSDAKDRLAFTVDDDKIILKVANIPLRSVWEVSLRVVGPVFPRAEHVRVWPIVADCAPREGELARLLAEPADWGHVPNTIWKIFKYLKFKTPDDDLILSK